MTGSIPPNGPPAGFPTNPSYVPKDWRPIGDSPNKCGGLSVVYQTPTGKTFTVSNLTQNKQKGSHWNTKK